MTKNEEIRLWCSATAAGAMKIRTIAARAGRAGRTEPDSREAADILLLVTDIAADIKKIGEAARGICVPPPGETEKASL